MASESEADSAGEDQAVVAAQRVAARPSPSQPTLVEIRSRATDGEKVWLEKAKKCLLFEAGAAVQMGPKDSTANLQKRMFSLYKERVESFNPFTCEKTRSVLGLPPREGIYNDIIRPLFFHTLNGKEVDGGYLYVAYKNLKSDVIVHWLPAFNDVRSGDSFEDRLNRAHTRVWLARETKKNNAFNNRNKGRSGVTPRPEPLEEDIPPRHFVEHPFVEMPMFILYHGHKLFQQEEGNKSQSIEDSNKSMPEGSPAVVTVNRVEQRKLDKKRRGVYSSQQQNAKYNRVKKDEVSLLSSSSTAVGDRRRERHEKAVILKTQQNSILQQQNQLKLCEILMQCKDSHAAEFDRVIKSTVESIVPTKKPPHVAIDVTAQEQNEVVEHDLTGPSIEESDSSDSNEEVLNNTVLTQLDDGGEMNSSIGDNSNADPLF